MSERLSASAPRAGCHCAGRFFTVSKRHCDKRVIERIKERGVRAVGPCSVSLGCGVEDVSRQWCSR